MPYRRVTELNETEFLKYMHQFLDDARRRGLMQSVPLTYSFSSIPEMVIGHAEILNDGFAATAWEFMAKGMLVIVPGYLRQEDGSVRILELSMIPREHMLPVADATAQYEKAEVQKEIIEGV